MSFELGNARDNLPDELFTFDVVAIDTRIVGRGIVFFVENTRDFGNLLWLNDSICKFFDPQNLLKGSIPPEGSFFHCREVAVFNAAQITFPIGLEIGLYGRILDPEIDAGFVAGTMGRNSI